MTPNEEGQVLFFPIDAVDPDYQKTGTATFVTSFPGVIRPALY
jgi:hypothetical protein